MARYNKGTVKAPVKSFIEVTDEVTLGHKGQVSFVRTLKSELFLLGVSSFNEDSFYGTAEDRNLRVVHLVKQIVKDDPQWITDFVGWLRSTGNIRTQSMVIALEGAKAMIEAGVPGGRKLVDVALQRADEPAEAIAYWTTTHGRKIPQAIKRGIADAAVRLYNERSIFKYDTKGKTVRFADVIQLVHPSPRDAIQSDLFKFALDRRYNDDVEVPHTLAVASNRVGVKSVSGDELRSMANDGTLSEFMKSTAMTWENVASQISGGMDAKAWESVIPNLGYMALLRNLNNFIEAGVSRPVMNKVLKRIADPDEVAKSKQLPFRFMSAMNVIRRNASCAGAVSAALDSSLSNVPVLKGRTLILVDMSGSMFWNMSNQSSAKLSDTAAIFGSALALNADNADLVIFGTGSRKISFDRGYSVSTLAGRVTREMGGTDTARALSDHFNGHDRVIIITDEQADGYVDFSNVNAPVYIWNLMGYKPSMARSKKHGVFNFGGLSDSSFKTIEMIESANSGAWPWLS